MTALSRRKSVHACSGSRSQVIMTGQGLNDDMWHTLRFSRRANNIKFQVDDETPIAGE